MNKTELVEAVAKSSDISKTVATKAVDAVFESITKSLEQEDKVTLIGFGTFEVRERSARTARNPRTGDPINIAATKVPAFKAGKKLKEAVKK